MGDVLIVEDQVMVGRAVERVLRRRGLSTTHVSSKRAAFRLLRGKYHLRGIIIDIGLGGARDGLDVLDFVATKYPAAPRAIYSGLLDGAIINRVHRLGATFICKPGSDDDFCRFSSDALSACIEDLPLRQHLVAWGLHAKLTAKEQEILALDVSARLSHARVRVAAGVSEATLATHHRAILAKAALSGEPAVDIASLVVALLLSARLTLTFAR